MNDELDNVHRYVNGIDPPDAQTMANVKRRLNATMEASVGTAGRKRSTRPTHAIRWAAAVVVVLAVGVALLIPNTGHRTPTHARGFHLQDRLVRVVVGDANVTVAAGNYDMTINDTTTPATQCVANPGGVSMVGGPVAKSTNSSVESCGTGGALSSVTGHGTVNTDPYAMVVDTEAGALGPITLYENGTDVWEVGGGNYGLSAPGQAGPGAPLSGYAGSVEGTVGQVQGALDMQSLASGTGYLDLEAQEIQGAQPAGTGSVGGVAVTIYKLTESGLQDPDVSGLTSEQVSTIRAADAIIKSSGFSGTTTWISVDSEGYIREQKIQYTLPDGSMVSDDTILSNFGCAGTVLMPGQTGTSTPPTGCVSPDTAGSSTSTTTPSSGSLPQPSTPPTIAQSTPPTTPPTSRPPSDCVSGTASVPVDRLGSSICMDVGATLTATFDDSHSGIGQPGGWIGPAQIDNSSVASLGGSSSDGTQLVTTVKALTTGTATVSAYFSQQCSSGDSTQCTIPPQGIMTLVITVVS